MDTSLNPPPRPCSRVPSIQISKRAKSSAAARGAGPTHGRAHLGPRLPPEKSRGGRPGGKTRWARSRRDKICGRPLPWISVSGPPGQAHPRPALAPKSVYARPDRAARKLKVTGTPVTRFPPADFPGPQLPGLCARSAPIPHAAELSGLALFVQVSARNSTA